jgi:hypothetical protein
VLPFAALFLSGTAQRVLRLRQERVPEGRVSLVPATLKELEKALRQALGVLERLRPYSAGQVGLLSAGASHVWSGPETENDFGWSLPNVEYGIVIKG